MTLSTKKARSLTNKPFQRRSDLPVELSSDQRYFLPSLASFPTGER